MNYSLKLSQNSFYSQNISSDIFNERNFLTLCAEQQHPPELDAGIKIFRGINTNALILWNEQMERWYIGSSEEIFEICATEGNAVINSIVYVNTSDNAETNENVFMSENIVCASGLFVGTTSNTIENCAIVQIDSTTNGILIPSMTSAQKLSIVDPANALLVYDTDYKKYSYYDTDNQEWINILYEEDTDIKSNILENYKLSLNGSAFPKNIPMSQYHTEYFDLISVKNISDSVFDGRYIYFCPQQMHYTNNTFFVRYDTTKPFLNYQSYSSMNLQLIHSNCKNYNSISISYDNNNSYLYLAPAYKNNTCSFILRYNVSKLFDSVDSYDYFDTNNITELFNTPLNFTYTIKADNYIYFVPGVTSGTSYILRYNILNSFTHPGSYEIFNLTMLSNNNLFYSSAVFDGKYLYLSPKYGTSNAPLGNVIRYDTEANFTDQNSYVNFDTSVNINSICKGYSSCVYDGRYVYFIPYNNNSYNGILVRYDTTLDFNTNSSWSFYDTAQINTNSKGFSSGIFDGKYLYLIPYYSGEVFNGQITRYDVSLDFNTALSYAVFNTSINNENSSGFGCAVYDGMYIYLVPNQHSVLTKISAYSGDPIQHFLGEDIEIQKELTTPLINSKNENLNIFTESSGAIILDSSVSIGPSPPATDAALDIQSTTKALKLPTLATNLLPTAENNGIMWYSTDAATPNKICICINGAIKTLN